MRVGIDARKIADFGIGTYIRGLLGGLLELGTNDEYVAFAPANAPIPRGIEHIVVDAPHYSVRELVTVGRAADRARLDVFHAPHYVVPFTRVPVVVTIHDLIHLHQPMRNPLARVYARAMIARAVRKSRIVLTVSEAVKRDLELELGARDVIVTPNGVLERGDRSRRFSSEAKAATAVAALQTFLFVGNDKPHKNIDTLVEAMKHIEGSLTLVGAPFARFRDRANVIVKGFVSDDELASLYDSAIALVVPSHEEGFGLPALEAMARGTPVITSLASALVEVTSDAALHVDARDARALAEVMTRVASDASLRDAMRARGIARAREFTWRRCAESTRRAWQIVEHRGTSGVELRF